jgi:hypothetical protein
LCEIFSEKSEWHRAARRSFERWGVPESVQLAVVHQESRFRADARPDWRWALWIFPLGRPSSAYGYGQVKDGTWADYTRATDRRGAQRDDFADVVDFIGWYGDLIHRRTGVEKDDAYHLYLAYHEGPGGFTRGSHRGKPWLLEVARKVEARARLYLGQYLGCRERLACISHQLSTAAAESTASSRPSPSGRLDVLPSTPSAPSGPRAANLRHSRRPRYASR